MSLGIQEQGRLESEVQDAGQERLLALGYMRSGIHILVVYKQYLALSRAVFPRVSQGALVLLMQKDVWKTLF